ncbi:hypothetical protein DFH29DRAFT_1004345 [Suillus ampliporus]|nr:hypothetical protein DFH29DRAFT_1004345 [Suillus ampliporus]
MSTPVDTSFIGLKALTAQIMGIISGAQQIPLGQSHFALTAQVSSLVSDVVKEYGTSPHIPGLVWPNWNSIGYDDPCLLKHSWRSKIVAWEALGDHTFDLPVAAPPSTGLIPVNLPSPPVITSNVASLSTNPTTKYQDKGKGKAIVVDSEPESKALLELEDDDEPIIKPVSCGVLEVVLPPHSKIVARTPNLPRSPWVLTKKPFGPAIAISGSRLAVVEPSQPTPDSLVQAPAVVEAGDILIPGPNNPCHACNKQEWPCAT